MMIDKLEKKNLEASSSSGVDIPSFSDAVNSVVEGDDKMVLSEKIRESLTILNGLGDKLGESIGEEVKKYSLGMKKEIERDNPEYDTMLSFSEKLNEFLSNANDALRNELKAISFSDVPESCLVDLVKFEIRRKDFEKFRILFSHDFVGAPFDRTSGFLRLLASDKQYSDEKIDRFKAIVLSNTVRYYDFLEEVLSLSREPVCVESEGKDILFEERNAMELYANTKGVKLVFDIDDDLEFYSASDLINMVLRNFVNNAIKFTSAGDVVSVKVKREVDNINFEVSDNGKGISRDALGSLRKRFSVGADGDPFDVEIQKKEGTNREMGTGWGTGISTDCANKIFGRIEVESEEGEGSCFSLIIPAGDAEETNLVERKNARDEKILNERLEEKIREGEVTGKILQFGGYLMKFNSKTQETGSLHVSRGRSPKTYDAVMPLAVYVLQKGMDIKKSEVFPYELLEALNLCLAHEMPEVEGEDLSEMLSDLKTQVVKFLSERSVDASC